MKGVIIVAISVLDSANSMNSLLNSASSTNSSGDIADVLSEESTFQTQLENIQNKVNNSKTIKTMTAEEIQQRDDDLREASTELEAILLKMMFNEMCKTVPKDELFGDDNAMDIYKDMYNEEITKVMANGGGIGLANYIYEHMKGYNH